MHTNASQSKFKPLKYRADIDGLRALAVLAVVGFHAFPNWVKGGFVGVDIFFVISGFLISTILFESFEKNTFSFINFYKKRIKRIFPALIFVLGFCIILGWFVLFPHEYKQLGKHIAGGAGFISNFLLWFDVGYFDNAAETKPLLHLWSLGIEEQFYIIWPFLIWFVWKKQLNLLTVTMFIILISFIFNVKEIHTDAVATFYSPQTRFWELLCGSLLAWIIFFKSNVLERAKEKSNLWLTKLIYKEGQKSDEVLFKNLCSFSGLLIILFCTYSFSKKLMFPGAWALLPILGALLIILGGKEAWVNRNILSSRIMVWFGLISYPLYLWHWPLLSFARVMTDDIPHRVVRITAVVSSIFLAWITYKIIEKPIRYAFYDKTKVFFLIGGMFTLACFGLFIQKYDGFDYRKKELGNNEIITIMANPLPILEPSLDCGELLPALKKFHFSRCVLSKKVEPEIMFLGDSHTWHYQNAIWQQFPANSVLMLVEISCLPFSTDDFLKGECKDKYNAVISFLESNKSIKKIYLSGYWAYLMTGGFEKEEANWRNAKPLDAKKAESFIKNGRYFLTKVLKANKEVVIFKDIPDLDFNINSCFKTRPLIVPYFNTLNKECAMNSTNYAQRIKAYDLVLQQLLDEFPKVKVYDPRPLFCKKNQCIARDKTLPYYFNGDHLNYYGANIVMADMLKKQNIA